MQELREGWAGVQRAWVDCAGQRVPALAYPDLSGPLAVGADVLVNTNALRRGLGTGGEALVVAVLALEGASASEDGHLVKARYTPMQTMVTAVDDPDSPHHAVMREADAAPGLPVVVADLHSALPAILAGARMKQPEVRAVLVHTDGAALPAAFSRTAAQLREAGWIESVISCGQAFGGDMEAVSVHSALLAARHVVDADLVIAVQGPGNLGSGTPWGFSGLQVAETLHAAAAVQARPIAVVRVSGADPRPRHRGLSHHSATVLGRAIFTGVEIPVPHAGDAPLDQAVRAALHEQVLQVAASRGVHHRLVEVDDAGLDAALASTPVRLSTMGRSLEEDPAAFRYAALAGVAVTGAPY